MNRARAEQLRMNEKNWKFGIIYVCRDDPRVIVRNRHFLGWAWNFGNNRTAIVLPIFIALFLGPIAYLALRYHAELGTIIITGITSLLSLIGIAHYIARGPR
jgi:hypothetical protein